MLRSFKPGLDVVYDLLTVETIMHDGRFRDILIDNEGRAIYVSRELPHDLSVRLRIRTEGDAARIDIERPAAGE